MLLAKDRSGASRSLAEIVPKSTGAFPTQRLMQAATIMSERRSAIVVTLGPDGDIVGLLTPKDLLFRAVAATSIATPRLA